MTRILNTATLVAFAIMLLIAPRFLARQLDHE